MQQFMDPQGEGEDQQVSTEQISPVFDPTGSSDVTRLMLETQDVIDAIEHKLKGEAQYFNEKTQSYDWKEIHKPLMNGQGVSAVMMLLSNYLHRHSALSNLSEEDISRLGLRARVDLITVLRLKWKEFDCERAYLGTIVSMVDSTVYMMLRRAYKGGERESMSGRYKLVESIVQGPKKQSFNPLNVFKR